MRRTLFSLLVIVTLFAAGCGGGGDDPTVSPSPTDGTTTAGSPTVTEPTTDPTTEPTVDATDDPVVTDCSAAGTDLGDDFTENPDLTGPANETRRTIAQAAVACDYDALAAVAGDQFTYSFGDSGDPATYWRALEQEGEPIVEILVTLLRLDVHVEEDQDGSDPMTGTIYSWPRAYAEADPGARQELEAAFGEEQVAEWFTPEGEYLGWRVGIRGDGEWIFYVAGD